MTEDINPNDILSAEYDYIAQSAFQANEDRAKVAHLYLLTVGSFLVAMLGIQSDTLTSQAAAVAFAGLFFILGLYAALNLVQLIRLRQAWHASVVAMNKLKDFYISHVAELQLLDAFDWNKSTIPAKFKPWSVSFLLALQISLLGGAAMGVAVIFFGLALAGAMAVWMWLIAFLVALNYLIILMAIYWWRLREDGSQNGS